ncbi:MAG: hypothetical protein JWO97_3910 [Acidobacteria bacterium]|nr:hypothetical protein [Acidobacteriota bacterium]
MIIECSSCHSRYQYDEDRFERKPSKKIKCAKCGTVFEIHNPAFATKAETDPGDATSTRREETKASAPMPRIDDTTAESNIPSTGKQLNEPALPAGRRLSLAIIDGPDAGSVYRITKPRVTVGRSGADLTLNDSECSRQHAAVEVRDTIYLLHDLKSTNGTMVNGEKITDATELQDKSEFQVGTSTLMLIVTDES